jgi:hypothetical protein
MRYMKLFCKFWYDFIVGDDWRVALYVIAGLGVTYLVSRSSLPAWWVMPVTVVVLLPLSLFRAVRRR